VEKMYTTLFSCMENWRCSVTLQQPNSLFFRRAAEMVDREKLSSFLDMRRRATRSIDRPLPNVVWWPLIRWRLLWERETLMGRSSNLRRALPVHGPAAAACTNRYRFWQPLQQFANTRKWRGRRLFLLNCKVNLTGNERRLRSRN